MSSKQRQKRQDDVRQPTQTPVADAIAIGTAAGGLVLGTMQAQAEQPQSEEAIASPTQTDIDGQQHARTAPASNAEPAVHDAALVAAQTSAPAADATVPAPLEAPAETDVVANATATSFESQLVAELSEQMTATLVKVVESAEPGSTAADLGQSIASEIVHSAQQIVASLDLGAVVGHTQNLGESILANIDAGGIADNALDATSGLAETILAEVDAPAIVENALSDTAGLADTILADTIGSLTDLPSALLGDEGPDMPGGLLSDLFYSDGAADTLAIPDLSDSAATLVADTVGSATGLLGLSYLDLPDQSGGHHGGLNALSLI